MLLISYEVIAIYFSKKNVTKREKVIKSKIKLSQFVNLLMIYDTQAAFY